MTIAICREQFQQFEVIVVAPKHTVFYTTFKEKAVNNIYSLNINEKSSLIDDMTDRAPYSRFAPEEGRRRSV